MHNVIIRFAVWGVIVSSVGACLPPAGTQTPSNTTTTGGGGGGGFGGNGGEVTGGGGFVPIDPPVSGCLALGSPTDTTHQAALDQLNAYRVMNQLTGLQYSRTLQQAADAHARDMYDRHFFSHTNPDGKQPSDRAVQAGFCHRYVGENIAMGQNSMSAVSDVMTAWKNSPGHNENMLRADFKYVGIGYYHIQAAGGDYYYWVQLFAFQVSQN